MKDLLGLGKEDFLEALKGAASAAVSFCLVHLPSRNLAIRSRVCKFDVLAYRMAFVVLANGMVKFFETAHVCVGLRSAIMRFHGAGPLLLEFAFLCELRSSHRSAIL